MDIYVNEHEHKCSLSEERAKMDLFVSSDEHKHPVNDDMYDEFINEKLFVIQSGFTITACGLLCKFEQWYKEKYSCEHIPLSMVEVYNLPYIIAKKIRCNYNRSKGDIKYDSISCVTFADKYTDFIKEKLIMCSCSGVSYNEMKNAFEKWHKSKYPEENVCNVDGLERYLDMSTDRSTWSCVLLKDTIDNV